MLNRPLRIVVIGGGPGGLALAQGLKKSDIPFQLYEKSAVRADYVQGFRMRMHSEGLDALNACLPPDLFEAFLATSGRSPAQSLQFDQHLNPLVDGTEQGLPNTATAHREMSVSRITLRQILLSGLGDAFHTERHFSRYEVNADGTVSVWFADGEKLECDLLVGADGASSRVRAQLLPHATIFDTGARRLAGKITLAQADQLGIPELFQNYNVSIKSSRGSRLGVSCHFVDRAKHQQFGLIGSDDPSHSGIDGFHFDNTTSYIWWNIAFPKDVLGTDEHLASLGGAGLLDVLGHQIADWHEDIRKLVLNSDPSTVALLHVRSSVPVNPWHSGPVTLLGDAIHSMTYFRALGANSAIRDAALLAAELAQVAYHGKPLLHAVADYETAMRAHGFDAVRSSLTALERSLAPLAA